MLMHLHAPVAQWIEYWPPKPRVARSIRAGRTIFLDKNPLIKSLKQPFNAVDYYLLGYELISRHFFTFSLESHSNFESQIKNSQIIFDNRLFYVQKLNDKASPT